MIEAAAKAERPRIVMRGWTDRPAALISAADVLVMPSLFEGVPLSMLEAMVLGTPVLGSDIDVFREYLPSENVIDFQSARLDEAIVGAVARRDAFAEQAARKLAEQSPERSRKAFADAVFDPLAVGIA